MERTDGSNFERLRRTFLLQGETDRVPLLEIGAHRDVKRAFLGERRRRGLEGEVQFWVEAGYDAIPIGQGISLALEGITKPSDAAGAAFANVTKTQEARYSLFREVESERRWVEEGKGVITSMEEFQHFPWPDPRDIDTALLDGIAQFLPPGMKVLPLVGISFSDVYALMGAENFFISTYENPQLVEALFEKIGVYEYETVRKVIKHPAVGALWVNGDVAYREGLMVSPKFMRKYVIPEIKRMADLAHQHGLPCLFHSDGKLDEIVEDLIACGVNALHPIEPKCMDIAYLKKKYGHKLCLCGNINLDYTLTLGTPEEVAAEVKQRLREIAPGGGYCVGSSNSVTEYVPLANFNAMRETVFCYGRYPISV